MNTLNEKNYDPGRILSLESDKKETKTPSYFPQITRRNDIINLIDAITKLEKIKKHKLEHINGIVLEANTVPKVIGEDLVLVGQNRLSNSPRESGSPFTNYYEFFFEYNMILLIDPNLDRINYIATYRKEFLSLGKNFFTTELFEKLTNNESVAINSFIENIDAVRRILGFQVQYKSNELLAPYIAISARTWATDLATNLKLYEISADVTKKFFPKYKQPIPVICIAKNMLNINLEDMRNKVYDEILEKYKDLNPTAVVIKITDFNTSSKDENYESILAFAQKLKEKIKVPKIYLNMNEFAYILLIADLDVYSTRMSRKTNIDAPIAAKLSKEEIAENRSGQYYIDRKMKLVKRSAVKKIICRCPFCQLYLNQSANKLDDEVWRKLRILHFIWIKNDELRMIITELKKNSLRAALQSMFADSDGWKNFVNFI